MGTRSVLSSGLGAPGNLSIREDMFKMSQPPYQLLFAVLAWVQPPDVYCPRLGSGVLHLLGQVIRAPRQLLPA